MHNLQLTIGETRLPPAAGFYAAHACVVVFVLRVCVCSHSGMRPVVQLKRRGITGRTGTGSIKHARSTCTREFSADYVQITLGMADGMAIGYFHKRA